MSDIREAFEKLRKAVERMLKAYDDAGINYCYPESEALRQALAATEQGEPVAWDGLLVEGERFKSLTHGWVTYKGVDVYQGQMTHKFKPDEYEMAYWLPDSLNVHLGDTSQPPKQREPIKDLGAIEFNDGLDDTEQSWNGPLAPGQVLLTKDGRQIGNAIVAQVDEEKSEQSNQMIYHVITDFGNEVYLNRGEIVTLFHIEEDRPKDLLQWIKDRKIGCFGFCS